MKSFWFFVEFFKYLLERPRFSDDLCYKKNPDEAGSVSLRHT
jgi:hypothetical protein